MAYMCRLGYGECDGCGYCTEGIDDWDEDDNEAFRGEDYEEYEEEENDGI